MSVSIRNAVESDTEEVSSVLQEAAQWLSDQGMPMWKADALGPETIAKEISDFHVAEFDRRIAGVIKFQTEDEFFWPDVPGGESAFVHRLAVRRRFAGRGVSTALLDFAVRTAGALGKNYLRLDCATDRSKLRGFYEAYGFVHHSDYFASPFHVARYEFRLANIARQQ
jgi:GNAT superfamily N-acetyltransferase